MPEIPFVKNSQLEVARAMEDAFLALPKSVVTFAGVLVERTFEGESPTYYASIGCPKNQDLSSCALAVDMQLKKHWPSEKIDIHVFWGRVRNN